MLKAAAGAGKFFGNLGQQAGSVLGSSGFTSGLSGLFSGGGDGGASLLASMPLSL